MDFDDIRNSLKDIPGPPKDLLERIIIRIPGSAIGVQAGDATSILRNGRLGMIDRYTIYSSRNLNVSSGVYDIIFGHPSILAFASQLVKNETLPDPDDFGKLHRGLQVYGYKVINDDGLGHMVAQKA